MRIWRDPLLKNLLATPLRPTWHFAYSFWELADLGKNHWFQEFKGRGKTCLVLEELLYILPRKLREAAPPTLMPAGEVVGGGVHGRYGGAAVRTRVT